MTLLVLVGATAYQIMRTKININTKSIQSPLRSTRSTTKLLATAGIGPEGCLLESPSGVNMMPLPIQALIFASIFGALYLGTDAFNSILESGKSNFDLFKTWSKSWPLLGK